MRIVGGELAGRSLVAPRGRTTRPTAAAVRASLFDALVARRGGLTGWRVLDLFAGSGALGIEALSRGAEAAWFVERDAPALVALRANLAALGLGVRGRVLAGDALATLGGIPDGPTFDLVLADPPYAAGVAPLLPRLALAPWRATDGLCALQHARGEELPARSGNLQRLWFRAYGSTAVSLYGPFAQA